MSRTVRALVLLLSILVALVMVLWSLQRQLLYYPAGEPPPVDQVLPGAESVQLTTDDGLELGAWWLPGGPTAVAVLPGNAGNRAGRAPLARALQELGLSVLLVDYRGYGGNPGTPSEQGLLADGRAAVDWVVGREDVEHLVLFGESLGAAVALGVAAEHPPDAADAPDALVLRSPFTSIVDMARVHLGPVPEALVRDRYPSVDRIGQVTAPVLVVAAERDEVVPFEQSRRLAEAAGGGAAFVSVAARGHNDPALFDGDELLDAVAAFLTSRALLPST
jgi:uncharacterized protein